MPTTIQISEAGRKLLANLAKEADTSMTAVLDAALESYRRECFLTRAAKAYDSLAADPIASEEFRREVNALEPTNEDDLVDCPF
jgi:hypothetical protein